MLLPSTGATPALVRKVPVVVFTNVSDDVLPSLKPVRSPKVTAPVIANRPPFVIVPAPRISMFPALHVTVPLLVTDAPALKAFSTPFRAKLAPELIVNGLDRFPPPHVAVLLNVVPPASANVPPVISNTPSTSAEPVPFSVAPPAILKNPPLATSAAPPTVSDPPLAIFKLSAFKKPSMLWADVRLTTASRTPRSIKTRCPATGTPKLQLAAVSQAPIVLLSQKLTVAAGPKNSIRLLPT